MAGVDGAHTSGVSKDFGEGIQVFIERFIESARDAGLSRAHLIELLAKPLAGKIRELPQDASVSGRSASIRSLNEVLVAVQTKLASGGEFAEARAHFVEEFPSALAAYLATIEDAANGAHTIVEASRKLEQVRVIRVGSPVNSTAVSPEGTLIASGSDDGVIRLFDRKTGSLVKELRGHTDWVRSVGFSSDGRYLVSGGDDRTIRLCDVASGKQIKEFEGHTNWVVSVGFSRDGKYVVSGSEDGTIRIWDVASGQEVRRFVDSRRVWSVGFSPDGKYVLSGGGDGAVRIWDVASGKQLKKLEGHKDWARSVGFSPDGRYLVSGGDDATVRLWEVASGKQLKKLEGHMDWLRSVSFSPDGRYLVSGGDDRTIRLWDVAIGRELKKLEGHSGRVLSVGFSPDGQAIISGSDDGSIRIQPASDVFPDAARLLEFQQMRAKWLADLKAHPLVFENSATAESKSGASGGGGR